MKVYLIRHGETDFNRRNIIQGSGVDTDLNDTGRAQGKAFHQHHGHHPFELVVTSALKRTKQTVHHFLEAGLPHLSDARINELHWGITEGKESTPEGRAAYLEAIAAWESGDLHVRLEGGESAHELKTRIAAFFEDLKQRPEKLILVASHGRTMRGIISYLKTGDLRDMESVSHHNTGLYVVELQADGTWTILVENDTNHLA